MLHDLLFRRSPTQDWSGLDSAGVPECHQFPPETGDFCRWTEFPAVLPRTWWMPSRRQAPRGPSSPTWSLTSKTLGSPVKSRWNRLRYIKRPAKSSKQAIPVTLGNETINPLRYESFIVFKLRRHVNNGIEGKIHLCLCRVVCVSVRFPPVAALWLSDRTLLALSAVGWSPWWRPWCHSRLRAR